MYRPMRLSPLLKPGHVSKGNGLSPFNTRAKEFYFKAGGCRKHGGVGGDYLTRADSEMGKGTSPSVGMYTTVFSPLPSFSCRPVM